MAILMVTAKGTSLRIVTHLLIVLLFLTSLINIVYLGSHLFSLHPISTTIIPEESQQQQRRTSTVVVGGGVLSSSSTKDYDLSVVDTSAKVSAVAANATIPITTTSTTSTRVVRDDTVKIEDSSSEYDPMVDLDDRFSSGHDEEPEEEEENNNSAVTEDSPSNNSNTSTAVVDLAIGGAPIKSPIAGDLQQLRRMDHDDDGTSQGDDNSNKSEQVQPEQVAFVETMQQDEEGGEVPLAELSNDEPKPDATGIAKPDDELGSDDGDGNEEEGDEEESDEEQDNDAEGVDVEQASGSHEDTLLLGKEPIFSSLEKAGIHKSDLDEETIQQLPTWEQVMSLYYPQATAATPVIYGLETCEQYRHTVAVDHQFFGIAGLFNTGTNALDWALAHNIENRYTRWQVPWGKHRLAKVKWTHTVRDDWDNYNKTNVLPIVIIKDPFTWMQSMCNSPYSAVWRHSEAHCPNLVPTDNERQSYPQLRYRESIPIKIEFDANSTEHWDSLLHLWNDWYLQYYHATYPRLMVRFEDLLFLPEQLLEQIAQCVGTDVKHPVQHKAKTSKEHGSNTDLVHAIIKFGNAQLTRVANMTSDDLHFADQTIDATLRTFFQYQPSKLSSQQDTITSIQ